MNGGGALGPSGFGGCFYQAFWDIVGMDVYKSFLQLFDQGWLLRNLNSNMVVLIPKVPGADTIENLRLIALANFQFKIITKGPSDNCFLHFIFVTNYLSIFKIFVNKSLFFE